MSWTEDHTVGGRVTIRDVLFDAEHRLGRVGVPSPNVDAAELVAFALGTTRNRLFLQDEITGEQKLRVEQLLARRLTRVPLQHLLGTAGFRHIEVEVGPGVFIPRPETELVTEAGLRELAAQPVGQRIGVDLCSGSGAIAISLALEAEGSRVHAVELSDDAITWTRRNVLAYEDRVAAKGSRVEVLHEDATTVADPGHPLAGLTGQVAVVVTNPPYIPDAMIPREPEVRDHEPGMALYGGDDGMDVIRGVLRTAAILLRPGGLVVIEHADVQGLVAGVAGVPAVTSALVADASLSSLTGVPVGQPLFTSVADRIDLNGLPRFTLARRAGASS
ncbi:MAG: peptide chain release factor N(5)-glutamine methyltransferase [Actinobacteria bacterium]|nr:peptide chain release factor N(5)-glutamine methyltransferase [Actinomycetota bacterium]